jgi:cytochrome P450
MQALEERDFFSDYEILKDPYAYFEAVRDKGPIYQVPGRDYLIVTGFDEILEVLKNSEDFSAIIGLQGAAAPLPFKPEGSDIKAQVEAHRAQFLGGDLLVNYDDQHHSLVRALLSPLFTPSRLKANERYIAELSDKLVKKAVSRGGCELIKDIATPFVTLVIADLLGVPVEDRQIFMDAIEAAPPPGSLQSEENDYSSATHPLVVMGGYFARYVQDRRNHPRNDVLSEISNAKYPDGSTPELGEIVRLAVFLFGAGQDTSAKLLGNAMRYIVEQPGLQAQLRDQPSLIPQLLEEVLRLEGSTKQTARLARRDTRIGDWPVPAGTKVMLALAAGNRDPRRWEKPHDFALDRAKIKEHIAFGRGKHVCAGAPLARVEVRIILEKFLEHTEHLELDEKLHGPRGKRELDYEPSFIVRGLVQLNLKIRAAAAFVPVAEDDVASPPRSREPAAAPAAGYSTATSTIGELLRNPSAKAELDKHLPGVSSDPQIAMAAMMTLRAVQAFAPDKFSNQRLDALDADLAKLAQPR